jgi:hypothetical protein
MAKTFFELIDLATFGLHVSQNITKFASKRRKEMKILNKDETGFLCKTEIVGFEDP